MGRTAQQKSIKITGIPNTYKGKIAMLALAPSVGSQSYTAYSLITISGASVSFPLSDWITNGPWNGSGNFAFVILIGETAQAIADEQYLYTGQTTTTTKVSSSATTVQWSKFGPLGQIVTQKSANQKSITVKGIPGNYKNKFAMLALAPSVNSQTYTAYAMGTISGANATFNVLDWTTDKPWNGSGDFAFIILIGENAQTIAGKQYLYTGQTTATTSVNQNTTTIQWSQFIFMAQ